MRVTGTRQGRVRHGMAATELAVILPLLVTLVLGCVDFGRFAHSYLAVTNAARAGAGLGGMKPYTPATYAAWQDQVRQAVVEEMSGLGSFDASRLSVTVTGITEANGDQRVQVEVRYPFQTIIDWPGIPADVTLRRVVVVPMIR